MDLFEKFSAVSVSAGSRISDLDRFFCEQHQAAYHAARSALLELRCIWEDVEKNRMNSCRRRKSCFLAEILTLSPEISASRTPGSRSF